MLIELNPGEYLTVRVNGREHTLLAGENDELLKVFEPAAPVTYFKPGDSVVMKRDNRFCRKGARGVIDTMYATQAVVNFTGSELARFGHNNDQIWPTDLKDIVKE